MVNTAMLRGKIVEKGMNVPGVAGRMGINGATLYRRLANGDSFTIGEARQIAKILGLSHKEMVSIFLGEGVSEMEERKEDSRTRCNGGGCPAEERCWPGAIRPGETEQEWTLRLLNQDYGSGTSSFDVVYTDCESSSENLM